jgi:hypothetical protein
LASRTGPMDAGENTRLDMMKELCAVFTLIQGWRHFFVAHADSSAPHVARFRFSQKAGPFSF